MKITIKTKGTEITYEDNNSYNWTVYDLIQLLDKLLVKEKIQGESDLKTEHNKI